MSNSARCAIFFMEDSPLSFYIDLKVKLNRIFFLLKYTNIFLIAWIVLFRLNNPETMEFLVLTASIFLLFKMLKYIYKIRQRTLPNFLNHIQHLMDFVIIAYIIHLTGGAKSHFTLLYFFPVIRHSILYFRFGGLKSAFFCSLVILYFDTQPQHFWTQASFISDIFLIQTLFVIGWLIGKFSQISTAMFLMEALNEALHNTPDLETSIQRSLQLVLEHYRGVLAGIMFFDKETNTLRYRYLEGSKANTHWDCSFKPGEGIPGTCFELKRSIHITRLNKDSRAKYPELLRGIGSAISVPLKVKNEMIGVVNFAADYFRHFDKEDIFPLQFMADAIANAVDKAEHERTDKELLKRNENIFETVSNGLIALDIDGRITMFNREAQAIFGYQRQDVLGKCFWDVFDSGFIKDNEGHYLSPLVEALMEGRKYENIPFYRDSAHGERLLLEVDTFPILDEEGNIHGAVSVFKNVTTRREMEEQMQQAEKFAVIGQLAAGLAHEIRNPLTSVRGFVQLLQSRTEGEKNLEYLGYVVDEIDRVNSLIKEFLLLAKPSAPKKQPTDIEELLEKTVGLMNSAALLQDITVSLEIANPLPVADVDWEQIKQVFINIIQNAFEAMTEGGRLDIRGKYMPRKKQVILEFEDSGPGIPREMLNKVFNPFFTTKDEGSGLGLPVSYKILENHGGNLRIKSTKGKGTTLIMELPVNS